MVRSSLNPPRRSHCRPLSVQRHIANARERKIEGGFALCVLVVYKKIETILVEGVGLSLCSDARGSKIETLDQGNGLGCCGETLPSY